MGRKLTKRILSVLLVLAMVITGIGSWGWSPEVVKAAEKTVDFYYYFESEDNRVPAINIWNDSYNNGVKVGGDQKKNFEEVSEQENWYKVQISYDSDTYKQGNYPGISLFKYNTSSSSWSEDWDGKSDISGTDYNSIFNGEITNPAYKDGVIKSYADWFSSSEPTVYDKLTNGDFKSGLDNWTCSGSGFGTANNDNNNNTTYCNFWTESGGEASISQKVKVEAGTYVVTAKVIGNADTDFPFALVIKNESETTLGSKSGFKTTAYNVWDPIATNSFTLSEETTVTISFERTDATGAWCGIDDVELITSAEYENRQKSSVLAELKSLYTTCSGYIGVNYSTESYNALSSALEAAGTVITSAEADINTVTLVQLQSALTSLTTAQSGLVPKGVVVSSIKVDKIDGITSDFIRGVDVSSYISEKDSGVKYYDFDGNVLSDQGFFDLLHESGVNYVRIRVWNNPYDANGNGYGGGNNDIEKAKRIGQWATTAGMKVLVDYHFSDFWTDPGKQYVPKAWRNKTVDEKAGLIEEFAYTNTKYLVESGVNVGMVQIGNETNAFFCGETDWENICKLFNAGSKGVRKVATEKGKSILVALHFADPGNSYTKYADNLITYSVDYDVFATSYYEFYHGTLENMKSVMQSIATKTGKMVMVAETSWATTLEDGDGHENQIVKGKNQTNTYEYSAGGQAKEVRDVMNAIAEISDEKGIGVFYWEPAWIPVQYAYDASGNLIDSVKKSNQQKWEQYGSGWAASYGGEYQVDAKTWWGGSAMDNQAMFDMYGHPLESEKYCQVCL